MYEALLQSADRPFRATPDSRFYYPHESIENARQSVLRAMLRAEGPCLVLGGAGLGKSMLSQLIEIELESRFDVIKLHASGLCSRRALLQAILFELQMPFRGLSEGELRMSIMDRMMPSPETAPDGLLVIVDEAHTLSTKLLEELRLITNFARNGQPRARLVLIGNMRLEDTFANPQMDSFNQRIAVRCYLQPMSREQTAEFVRHQLKCVQANPASIITNEGLKALYAASEGVPRLVNQVMDHALVLGVAQGQCPISASLIEEAWSDLQQLPAPWHSIEQASTLAADSSPIEFGSLNDEEDNAFETHSDTSSTSNDHQPFDGKPIEVEDIADSEASARGFFAAFADDAAYGVRKYMEGIESDESLDEMSFTEYSRSSSEARSIPVEKPTEAAAKPAPQVVFDASRAFGHQRHSVAYPRELASAPSTAAMPESPSPLPLKHDKSGTVIPVRSEQTNHGGPSITAIDAQGLWAEDPPINAGASSTKTQASPLDVSNKIFGEDFEEEIPLDTGGAMGRVHQMFEPKLADATKAAQQENLVAQSAYRESTCEVKQSQPPGHTTRKQQAVSSAAMTESLVANWTVDVNASAPEKEIALQVEIEDLVSQLNFSAFAVEPYSIEQIEVDFTRSAVSSKKSFDSQDANDREAIYTLHSNQTGKAEDIHNNLTLDDDRDLLIIEEELPVSSRGATDSIGAPVVKSTPYSQLFAKLRH